MEFAKEQKAKEPLKKKELEGLKKSEKEIELIIRELSIIDKIYEKWIEKINQQDQLIELSGSIENGNCVEALTNKGIFYTDKIEIEVIEKKETNMTYTIYQPTPILRPFIDLYWHVSGPMLMEKEYKNLVYFFGLIALITFVGFFKKYFALAPDFPGLKAIHHLHALLLSTWLCMLIVQPILIARKKMEMHRMLGKFSYFLMPAAFVSMLLAYHNPYLNFVAEGKPEPFTLGFVFAPATDAIPFAILYLLAILNKRNTQAHMRYMIATGIVVGGPGLGRIFMTWLGMDIFMAIQLLTLIQLLTFVGLIVYDRLKKKKFRVNPYTIAFTVWLVPNILIIFFPETGLWQNFARWLTGVV